MTGKATLPLDSTGEVYTGHRSESDVRSGPASNATDRTIDRDHRSERSERMRPTPGTKTSGLWSSSRSTTDA